MNLPRPECRFAPEGAVSSTTSTLLLFCLQAREPWLTLTAELTCPSAPPECSSPGQKGSRCRVGRRSSSRSGARVTPRRMDASAMRGDAAASDRATRSAPARPERARGGPGSWRIWANPIVRRTADRARTRTSALSPRLGLRGGRRLGRRVADERVAAEAIARGRSRGDRCDRRRHGHCPREPGIRRGCDEHVSREE